MKKQTLLKSTLCLLMALVCNVAWAQVATIQSSNSVENPEYMYELRSANNYWMTSYTSPTSTASGTGKFAFFAVVGQEGAFKIYSVDRQKWVSYIKADSYSAGTDKATLVDAQEDANAWKASIANGYWSFAPYKNDATVASIYWNWHGGVNSNPLDNTNKTIGFYGTIGDGGCKWTLYAYEGEATEEELSDAKSLIKVAPGYPKTSTTAYDALNNFALPSSKAFLNVIVTAYKTATDIILPEDGKAYKITNYSNNPNQNHRYLNYTENEALSVKIAEEDASEFVCRELSAGVYVFVTEDGKILTWPHSSDGYKGDGSYKGYSNNYATEYEGYSDWNKITIKKNGNNASDFGHLRLVARRYYSEDKKNAPNSSFVIKGSTGAWDRTGDSYHFETSGSNWYSTAWILTKVEHTNTPEQNLALAKIDAKEYVKPYAGKLGEGIGYAYYMAGETKLCTADEVNAAIDAAATIEDVNAITNSFKYEVPKAGTPYYLFDAAHNVYVDIHYLGAESNYPAVNQMATLSSEQQPLYITANPADGSWKIHTTLRGGSYLCQYTGGKQTWDSWVSADASNYSWGVEVSKDVEVLYYVLKNTGSNPGYLGCEDHSNGKVLYANQGNTEKLQLQLIEVPEEKPSVFVYRPTTRATTLVNGKKYMLYNTAFNGAEDRTGFLYDNGSGMGHSGAPKQKPATFKTVQDAYLWEIETTDEDGKYYLKAADGTYVNVSGNNGNAEPVALYIQPWNSSTATKAGVKSEAADGTVTENANIGADVFTISGTKQGNTGQDCWNGNPNTFSMWESAHPYAFYEVEATEKTFDEGFPIPGRTYYIYCDNDTRQYFYNDGGTLKVSEKRTEWSNEYLFTCLYDGEYFQFKNLKGKYLAHKTLSDNAHNFELASYLGGVNLKTPGGSYFVMKADGGFDQSSEGQYDPASTDFSTVYKFEEFNFPVDGEVYYIYADTYQDGTYVNRFLYADGGNLKLNTSLSTANTYLWTCTVTEDGYVQFRNGAGKYLKHKGVQDSPYNFTLNKSNANHAIAATLFSVDANRYFTVKNNGSTFDQADRTYNQTSEEWCTDYVFMPINDVQVLTVNGSCWSDAQATWNGETKTLPASWAITPHTVISDATLSVTGSDNFTFTGLYDGTTSLGETTEIESLDGSLTLTAKLAPSFFSASTTEGDLIPVRIRNVRDNSYTLRLNANENYTGKAVNSGVTAYGENEIWYLVGNEESFKIYHRIAGTGLHIVLEGTGENSAASMNTTTTNADFCLVAKDNGYAICPKSNTGQSFNMNGGAGKDIKLYRTSDGGSNWTIEKMDVNNTLTFSVSIEGETWEENRGAGAITITVNGIAGKKNIEDFAGEQKCYLPLNGTFTIASDTYRGYTFNGFVVNGTTVETLADQTCTEDLDVEASYTANEEKVLYYTPDANGKPYRIPAIAAAPNGHIFAIADNRPCGNDIGYGEVDIKCRISKDNGATWGDEFFIADGLGELPFLSEEDRNKTGEELKAVKATVNNMHIGFGDAAVVADRESNKLLVMMVAGRTVCHNGRWDKTKIGDTTALAVNRVARVYAEYDETAGEWKWTHPEEVTDHMYSIFLNGETPTVTSMFIGSGKICQSRVVKKDQYYRLYCSIWTRDGGNRVIYSDDFGGTWNVLGTINDRPASGGDEPKVEELADGTVVLSSRKYNGRYFNLFTFSDNTYTTGTWGTVVSSNDVADGLSFGGNSTNGEIYKVKAIHKGSGRVCDVMLQSIPTGSGRDNVAIFYKELDATTTYTPTTIAQGWTKGKHVSQKESCYSTMIMQADGRIAFLFEEAPGGYCIVYIPYTIEDLTGGAYTSIGAPTTGYYYMISKATGRHEHLYNNALHTGNSGRTTLQSNTKVTTNNGIWHITNLGDNNIGIKNGDGNPIVAKDGSLAGAYSELIIGDTNIANDYLYYYFSNAALNCSSDKSINGINYLTTWQDGGPNADDNQWRFEPVSVEGKTIYEVVVNGDANAYVTYANGTTVQNAFNGGFFITDAAITDAQLSAGILNNEFKNEPTITIEGTTITLSGVKPLIVKQDLYNTSKGDGVIPPYRIPGITTAYNGRLITAAARLVCGTDPGYGQVDVVCRYSDDHGDTWSEMIDVAVGNGKTSATVNYFETAFGDPAIVADRTSSEVLIIAVAGCTVYGNGNTTRQNPNMIATIHSTDNGETWEEPFNATEDIYSLFDSGNPIQSAFVGGGKIFQSRIVKVGKYYRLYAAMCARPNGNRVIYSDDFGRTWHALGGASALPAPGGDEPKCEEMPDGRVILSSRAGGGRIYNIYTYSNTETAEGSWGTDVKSTFEGSGLTPGGNSTNGEILIVPVKRNSDGKEMYLALQSLPTGGGRTNVGIFYKELTDMTDINTVANFAAGWDGFFQVSNTSSAYSSMDLQADDRIGFIYEETLTGWGRRDNPVSTSFPNGEGQHNFDGFDNIYVAYPLEYITDGAYSIKRDVNRRTYVSDYFTALTAEASDEMKAKMTDALDALSAEPTIAEVDKLNLIVAAAQEGESSWFYFRFKETRTTGGTVVPVGSWGYVGDNLTATATPAKSGSYLWQKIDAGEGKFHLKSMNGKYLVPASTLTTSTTQPTAAWTIEVSVTEGLDVIFNGDIPCQVHVLKGGSLTNWGWNSSGTGARKDDDGCKFVFVEALTMSDVLDNLYEFDADAGKVGYYTDATIDTYKSAIWSAMLSEQITAAKTAVTSSTVWNMPVSGKAYTFKNVQKDGTTVCWFKYDANAGNITTTTIEAEATPFVCRLLENGKYVFMTSEGKYMTWRGDDSGNTGIRNEYDATTAAYTDVRIEKMTTGGNIAGNLSNTRYINIYARRNSSSDGCVVIAKNGLAFDKSGAPYYNDNHSSAIIMEEAAFGNTPQVNGVGKSILMSEDLHGKHMSTFSATYLTVAPEGVTAYYATKEDENVVLNAISRDKAIPANTGVILVSEEGGNAVMLPPAGETVADVAGNLMVGTAGAAKNMTGIAKAYILTGGAQGAGFYLCSGGTLAANKAYLDLSAQAGGNAPAVRIRLAGTQGGTTEIEGSELKAQGSQLIYDLQGRRVLNPTKGIYIVNGKKVVIK